MGPLFFFCLLLCLINSVGCVAKVTRVMKLGSTMGWDKKQRNANVCVARCYRRYDAPLADINQISVCCCFSCCFCFCFCCRFVVGVMGVSRQFQQRQCSAQDIEMIFCWARFFEFSVLAIKWYNQTDTHAYTPKWFRVLALNRVVSLSLVAAAVVVDLKQHVKVVGRTAQSWMR